jgi:hypothetical protein
LILEETTMSSNQLADLVRQRRTMELSAATASRDASGRLIRPTLSARIGQRLIGAGTRLAQRDAR